MPKNVKIKQTFSFKRLQRKFPGMVVDSLNVIGRRLIKSIMEGIDKGQDINENAFKPLSANTKLLGGSKPLKRTGKMQKGLKKKPATISNPNFVITMSAESRGDTYGAFHNQGYKNSYKPKQWFKGAKIPKREWFGIPKNMKDDGSEIKKAMKEMTHRVAKAWSKRGN